MTLAAQHSGRFTISRWLTPNQTALAVDDAGRQVVLKALQDDCLLKGKLHPNIRDRLARVRELAHPGIAHLHGVERVDGRAFLIWEFVAGKNLEEHVAGMSDAAELAGLSRELILVVQALHATGIVHGAIHGRNIVIEPGGRIRLTHISPLLYDETANDVHDLLTTLRHAVARRGWEKSALNSALAAADTEHGEDPLGQLRHRLGGGGIVTVAGPDGADSKLKRKMVLAALLLGLGGIVLAGILWWTLRTAAPAPLVPPEAPDNLTSR